MGKPLLLAESRALLGRGAVLHASSAGISGRAWVFLARSRGGKSTLVRMLAGVGASVIADDITLVCRGSDGVSRAMPCASFKPGSPTRPDPCPVAGLLFVEHGPACLLRGLEPVYAVERTLRQGQVMAIAGLLPGERDEVRSALLDLASGTGFGILRFSLGDDPAGLAELLG